MKDPELLKYLRKNDAAFVVEVVPYYAEQDEPAWKILNSRGEPVCLPDGVHINHAVSVVERHGKLLEKAREEDPWPIYFEEATSPAQAELPFMNQKPCGT